MKILVVNGPNLNMTGVREPEIYGAQTLDDINRIIRDRGDELGIETEFFQSNCEGAIIDAIHSAYNRCDGIIINPGAYTHYSYAIRDAIKSTAISAVEVHISNVHTREAFRDNSVIAPVCKGQICGLGAMGYVYALYSFKDGGN